MVGVFSLAMEWDMFFPHSPDPNVHVVSDVSRSFGCGAILLHSQWLQVEWPSSWSNVDITVKELVPIVVAAAVWGRCGTGSRFSSTPTT